MKYTTEYHLNSNRSRGVRERINLQRVIQRLDPRDFDAEPLKSAQVWRGGSDPRPLPRRHSPELLRQYRSRYEPHTGAKQIAKLATRNA